jgi:hypothetical protein
LGTSGLTQDIEESLTILMAVEEVEEEELEVDDAGNRLSNEDLEVAKDDDDEDEDEEEEEE